MSSQIKEGSLETALLELLSKGGQVFPGRDGKDGITYMCGSKQTIYWLPNSLKYKQLYDLAVDLKLSDPELVTGGRLVKHILKICDVRYENTYFHHYYRKLAVKGDHWHYQYYQEGKHGFCYEIDLKSAYWTSFINNKTCLLLAPNCWGGDNGALLNLKALFNDMPKFFRLQFLGTLASWQMKFYTKNSQNKIILANRKNISYGALFNSTHKAIKDTYNLLKEIHKRLSATCVRCHTDSLLIKKEQNLEQIRTEIGLLQSKGYNVSCKRYGDTWIKDLNTGFVGKFPIGSKKLSLDFAKADGIKLKSKLSSQEEILIEQLKREFEFYK